MGVMQGLAVVVFCYWDVRQELLAFVYKPVYNPGDKDCYLVRVSLMNTVLLCAKSKTRQLREGPG